MKEFRFKVLSEGEKLCHFSESEMVIRTRDRSYKIYKNYGFNEGSPYFYKNPNVVGVFDPGEIPLSILCLKIDGEYRIFRIKQLSEKKPEIDETFILIIKSGIGKLEIYDTESGITITNLPKEEV